MKVAITKNLTLKENLWKDNVNDTWIFLLEECSSGTYGKNCTKTCSEYCLDNKSCNHIDGACTDGCQDGYIGNICNTCTTF